MVVIDENEDIADIDNFYFLKQKPKKPKQLQNMINFTKKSGKNPQNNPNLMIDDDIEGLNINDGSEQDDSFGEPEKSKTTNLADLLY